MTPQQSQLVSLSQLLLIACDQSYAGNAIEPVSGQEPVPLASLPDAPLGDTFLPPYSVAGSGFVVHDTFEEAASGFKAVLYRNETNKEIILAIGGTDGADLRDWWSDVTHYGWNQWSRNRVAVLEALDGLIAQLGGVGSTTIPKIHFTGQSLGGALAQYAAYEFVETHRDYGKSRLSLVTFNGLGGLAGLREELPRRISGDPIPGYPEITNASFDPSVASGFGQIAHYGSLNDLIWRVGGGHLGGNVYSFAGLDFGNFNPETESPFLLDTINAHKIETGFYYPLTQFDQAGVSAFSESVSSGPLASAVVDQSYLRLDSLQKLASVLGNLFRQSETSSAGAMLKLLFGGLGTFALGDSEQVNRLVLEYVETRKRAGKYFGKDDEYEAAKDTDWAWRLRIGAAALAVSNVPSGPFGLILKAAGAIALAPFYSLVEGMNNDSGEFVLRYFDIQRQGAAVPDVTYEESLERSALVGAALDVTDPDGGDLPLTTVGELARDDVEGLAEAMASDVDWQYETSEYLIERAAALGMRDKAQAALNEFWSYSRHAAEGNPTLLASVSDQFGRFMTDWGHAVANVSNDLIVPNDTPLQVESPALYAQKRTLWNSVLAGLENVLDLFVGTANAAETHAAVVGAIDQVRTSAETVVLRPGRGANPFDEPSFDPDASPLAVGQLNEGSIQTFTVYLPYEAGAGGQRIKLELAGNAADKILVFADGEDVELGADGIFTLTVAEGQRELSFNIAALEDVDVDETFTLSAQLVALVDGNEVATHLEHEELELALDAEDEGAPAGGMELHGDWGLKLYPVFSSDGTPVLDEDGNQVFATRNDPRYPPFTNLERDPNGRVDFGEQAALLTGLDGADHIWLGEFGGAGGAIGGGGDDYFEGMPNVPNLIIGDYSSNRLGLSGNDVIEGGENLQPYSDPGFTREGEHIEGIGDDILFGGLGDDDIYADRISQLDEMLDPSTPALDQKGDWITGEQGDDRIFGSAAHDALFGGGGADEIHGGAGNDVLDGDDNYYNWGDAWWEIDPGVLGVTFFPVTNFLPQASLFEYYKDFGGGDILDGGGGDDLIYGMLGEDTLIGGEGDDRLEGWEGDDQLLGGAGDDILAGDFGRYEVSSFRVPSAPYRAVPGGVNPFLADPGMADQVGNDFLDGGEGNDLLLGEGGDDTLLGRDGSDTLFGDATYLPDELHGDDLLDGGAGDDSLGGNAGNDKLYGGDGSDNLAGGSGDDLLEGGTGNDFLAGDEGDDTLRGGEGADNLSGGAGADRLHGGGGDDRLDGGDDNDALFGDVGADQLDGGAGDDTLYGGSGEDVITGGEGDDLIDGGAGTDIVRGGPGDDTYVLALGYGSDLIEDSEGKSRIRFGVGVTPESLTAMLDGATLAATLNFGFAGDSATLNLTEFQVGGVEFSDGTSWTPKQFLQLVPALRTDGSDAGDVLTANPLVRNALLGFGGDDSVRGSANDDRLEGGDGADALEGDAGSDVYAFAGSDGGIDELSDSGIEARAYLDWYYGNQGISDWIERGRYSGQYKAVVVAEGGSFTSYFDSFEEAYAEFPYAAISLVEPLPSIAPLVRRDDEAAFDALVNAGVVSRDVVEFGPGLSLSDLSLTVTVNAADAADHPDQPWYAGGTLAVRWGSGGVDLAVPAVNYGFVGSNLLSDGSDPQLDLPGAWRGYRLGEGIETFRFADGSTYSLEEMLEQASVVELIGDYEFSRNSGAQLISRNYASIVFDADVHPDEVSVSRDGTALLITLGGESAQGRIAGWYDDPDFMPSLSLKFSSGPEIDAATLTELGLRVVGTDGDDLIAGLDGFDDVLSGAAGSDILDGGTGQDTYVFNRGDGVDTITEVPSGAGDSEASVVLFGPEIFSWQVEFGLGSLVVDYGEGDAVHFAAFNADDPSSTPVFARLEFDDGEVILYDDFLAEVQFQHGGTDGDDVLRGTGIGDFIDAGAGDDMLFGLGGEDNLEGGEGDDTLAGGPGDEDAMAGGEGSDTYLYAAGDGYDYVFEWSEVPGETDRALLTGGITPADTRVTRDEWSYHLIFGGTDRLVLDSMVVEPAAEIERIEFEDGTLWTAADLAARVELVPGTDLDDALWGTSGNDILQGLAGFDLLYGNGGDDLLVGGEGDDYYFFAAGDGADRVDNFDSNPGSWDSIRFADVASSDVVLAKSGSDLVLRLGGGDDVTLIGWYVDESRKIDSISFDADGAYWDAAMLEELAPTGGNSAPELSNPIGSQSTDEDSAFTFAVPGETFSDADPGDLLTYSAALADGSELPGWLSFDAETRTFSGTPLQADVGSLQVRLTATDSAALSAFDDFILTVVNVNDAPIATGEIAAQSAMEDAPFEFTLSEGAFADEDPDDSLDYSVTLAGGEPLPAWLAFDTATRSLSGTPANGDVGELSVRVTATDGSGASAEGVFDLSVANVNDAPTLANEIPDQEATEDQAFSMTLAADTFADVDVGDGLTYGARLSDSAALPGWLAFNAASRTFSGTPQNAHVGTLDVRVTATDGSGASASDSFTLTVTNTNDAPVAANAIADQTASEDAAFAFTVPEETVVDEDLGDALSWFASRADGSALPGWLSFDAGNREFSGTPGNDDVGSLAVKVTATDGAGLAVSDTFTLTVENVNDAPTLASALPDRVTLEDQPFDFTVPAGTFADIDAGDSLALSATLASGAPLPAWLGFTGGTFSGTPRNADVRSYEIRLTAADRAGATASDTFALTVLNVNDAPVVANPVGEQSFEAGSQFSFAVPAGTFADEDAGDSLSLSAGLFGGSALPTWLAFDPASATFTGNPGKKENGISHMVLTATDATGASVSTEFGLVIRAKPNSTVVGDKGDDVMYGGTGNNVLVAQGGNDALFGNTGNDLLLAGKGNDVLQGGAGSDVLHGGKGQNLLDGGAGNDVIFGGWGSSLIVGGSGNDLIHTGRGNDVLLFNRGDGSDTVFADRSGDNTLSFGGGIGYSDLTLSRSGKDLVVDAGGDDRVVLKNWYGGKRSVANLQFIVDATGEVQTFDFLGVVSAYDSARRESPGLTSWEVTNALLQFHLGGGDDAALGGDLAYWYARNRGFGGISLAAAQQVLGAASFGSDAQSLRPFNGLQEGFVKLT